MRSPSWSKGEPKGFVVFTDPVTHARRSQVTGLAARNRLPAVYPLLVHGTPTLLASGLLSYAAKASEYPRIVASYVHRLLKGAKPADLPIHQPTEFELGVNLKTAKALGLTIPPSLLARADQVIE
jgi:putative tryptophan/tyrosine transport system substrate-binding protein